MYINIYVYNNMRLRNETIKNMNNNQQLTTDKNSTLDSLISRLLNNKKQTDAVQKQISQSIGGKAKSRLSTTNKNILNSNTANSNKSNSRNMVNRMMVTNKNASNRQSIVNQILKKVEKDTEVDVQTYMHIIHQQVNGYIHSNGMNSQVLGILIAMFTKLQSIQIPQIYNTQYNSCVDMYIQTMHQVITKGCDEQVSACRLMTILLQHQTRHGHINQQLIVWYRDTLLDQILPIALTSRNPQQYNRQYIHQLLISIINIIVAAKLLNREMCGYIVEYVGKYGLTIYHTLSILQIVSQYTHIQQHTTTQIYSDDGADGLVQDILAIFTRISQYYLHYPQSIHTHTHNNNNNNMNVELVNLIRLIRTYRHHLMQPIISNILKLIISPTLSSYTFYSITHAVCGSGANFMCMATICNYVVDQLLQPTIHTYLKHTSVHHNSIRLIRVCELICSLQCQKQQLLRVLIKVREWVTRIQLGHYSIEDWPINKWQYLKYLLSQIYGHYRQPIGSLSLNNQHLHSHIIQLQQYIVNHVVKYHGQLLKYHIHNVKRMKGCACVCVSETPNECKRVIEGQLNIYQILIQYGQISICKQLLTQFISCIHMDIHMDMQIDTNNIIDRLHDEYISNYIVAISTISVIHTHQHSLLAHIPLAHISQCLEYHTCTHHNHQCNSLIMGMLIIMSVPQLMQYNTTHNNILHKYCTKYYVYDNLRGHHNNNIQSNIYNNAHNTQNKRYNNIQQMVNDKIWVMIVLYALLLNTHNQHTNISNINYSHNNNRIAKSIIINNLHILPSYNTHTHTHVYDTVISQSNITIIGYWLQHYQYSQGWQDCINRKLILAITYQLINIMQQHSQWVHYLQQQLVLFNNHIIYTHKHTHKHTDTQTDKDKSMYNEIVKQMIGKWLPIINQVDQFAYHNNTNTQVQLKCVNDKIRKIYHLTTNTH